MRRLGARDRISRKYGELLSGMPNFELNKRPYPPGQHGQKRTKSSEYGGLLTEKQKLKHCYNLSERQFRRYFRLASKIKGPTGEILIQLLETRLDNIVYRLGFAPTLASARQLVVHGHVLVDDRKVDIPSFKVKPNSVISLRDKVRKLDMVQNSVKNNPNVLDYLELHKEEFKGKLVEVPQRSQIPINVSERLVVEFYSR